MNVRLLSIKEYTTEHSRGVQMHRKSATRQILEAQGFKSTAVLHGVESWPPFELTPTWVGENIKGRYKPLITTGTVFFEFEADALLTYLTWY